VQSAQVFVKTIDLKGYNTHFSEVCVPGAKPQAILIDFYGGYSKDLKERSAKFFLLHDSMMIVRPALGDVNFKVHQSDQLTEAHFTSTHALLLKRMSDFVAHLRNLNVGAKIYLFGASFGGFFATSYAYHQSGGRHNEWAFRGIQEAFGDDSINPIDGIICHAAALHNMQKIMKKECDLSCVNVPMCYHFNQDDECVKIEAQMPFIQQLSRCNVVVSPFGAMGFLGEVKVMQNLGVKNDLRMRGHFNNRFSRREFYEQVLRFLGFEVPS
jgi:hypothetical protein